MIIRSNTMAPVQTRLETTSSLSTAPKQILLENLIGAMNSSRFSALASPEGRIG